MEKRYNKWILLYATPSIPSTALQYCREVDLQEEQNQMIWPRLMEEYAVPTDQSV